MTGKEKSAICNAVGRGLAFSPSLRDRELREAVALDVGKELEQYLGAGFNGERLLVVIDVARMVGSDA